MEEKGKPQVKFVEDNGKSSSKRRNRGLIALFSAIVVLIVIFLIPHRSMEKVGAYFENNDTVSALRLQRLQ